MVNRTALLSLAGVAVVAVVAGAFVALTRSSPRKTSAEQDGMVQGTAWAANEGGGALTAIDAGSNRVAAMRRTDDAPAHQRAATTPSA